MHGTCSVKAAARSLDCIAQHRKDIALMLAAAASHGAGGGPLLPADDERSATPDLAEKPVERQDLFVAGVPGVIGVPGFASAGFASPAFTSDESAFAGSAPSRAGPT
jgi:hypothetical protein